MYLNFLKKEGVIKYVKSNFSAREPECRFIKIIAGLYQLKLQVTYPTDCE
jgi:hypothetical protein